MDTRQLILDTAGKIFADTCDKPLLDSAEQGAFAQGLWHTIVANGFHQLGTPASGTTAADLFAFLQQAGRFAVPLPLAETLIANLWLDGGDAVSSIGVLHGERIEEAVWGHKADRVLGVAPASGEVVVADGLTVLDEARNLAGEPCVSVACGTDATRLETDNDPYAVMALGRVNLMAGALQTILELGIQFATERAQFGRAISKFQAIQHSLAVVAAEVAASKRAADAAVDALDDARFVHEVAASKGRVGEAVGVVAEQVHQIHGAMGFTHEHRLHHYTRRAWAWRDSYGNEYFWQQRLGRHLAGLGADRVWSFIATSA